jgi:hypothetical protein
MQAELLPKLRKPMPRIKVTPAQSNAAVPAEPPPFLPSILVKSNNSELKALPFFAGKSDRGREASVV